MSLASPLDITSLIDGSWSPCTESQGETTCGSTCCTVGQYCTGENLCENFCDTSQNVSGGQCDDVTTQISVSTSSEATTSSNAVATSRTSSPVTIEILTTVETNSVTVLVTSIIDMTNGQSAKLTSSTAFPTPSAPIVIQSPLITPSPTTPLTNTNAANSTVAQATSSSTPATASTASTSQDNTSKLISEEIVLSIAILILLGMLIALLLFLRRRNKGKFPRDPSGETLDEFDHDRDANATAPLQPTPHETQSSQHPASTRYHGLHHIRENRSRHNSNLAPDNNTLNLRPPPILTHTRPHRPHVHHSRGTGRELLLSDEESVSSDPPPSYRSQR